MRSAVEHLGLHLILPGVLDVDGASERTPEALMPSLSRLLSRADRYPCRGDEYALAAGILGVENAAVGPVSALGDGIDTGTAWWFNMTPVNLVPDIHQVLLTDPRGLEISPEERASLLRDIRSSGVLERFRMETGESGNWYLALDSEPDMKVASPFAAAGSDVAAWLPSGTWASEWMARLTEAQMVLHGSEVNRRRETVGDPPINSLWLWGGGVLPHHGAAGATHLFATDPYFTGLGALSGSLVVSPPADWDALHSTREGFDSAIAVIDCQKHKTSVRQGEGGTDPISALERGLLAPLGNALARGLRLQVAIYPANGSRFLTNRTLARRFWRRDRPLSHWLT